MIDMQMFEDEMNDICIKINKREDGKTYIAKKIHIQWKEVNSLQELENTNNYFVKFKEINKEDIIVGLWKSLKDIIDSNKHKLYQNQEKNIL